MIHSIQLFQIGSFNFKLHHVLVIGVLILAFSTSFLLRSQSIEYGFELNEFDPFFNFRATEYIVENGFLEYFEWDDDKSWYPHGRDVSKTSQIMLHFTAAITYQIFGGGSSLYDFTILFPAIVGSLTVIVIFALVRLFAGTFAGLIASLLFAISLPIMLRGLLGWFKSEPLGILYALLGVYLFLSGIRSENKKIAALKIIFGGIIMGFGMASWGGNQFFIIPLGLFIITLPFLRKDHNFLLWSIPLFVITFLLTAGSFERPGLTFVFGMGGISLIIPTIFLVSCILIQKISSDKNKTRNGLILLLFVILLGSSLLVIASESNITQLPSFRYLNALNPFLTTTDPLTDSVAEHATTSIKESFAFHTVFLIFSGIGVWLILTKKLSDDSVILKNETKSFVLIIGMTGVYVSSAFVRLEVFASISLIILCAIGLSILTKEIFKLQLSRNRNYLLKISYSAIIVILFIIPLVIPEQNWITYGDMPATIFTGGTMNPASNDWLDSLEWVKLNTPTNAVVAAWWDYGYWISTMAERTTLADNSTLIDSRIKQIAEIFLSNPNSAWNSLNEMNVDYVMIFVSGQKFNNSEMDLPIYRLSGGGDESKIYWFAQISQQPFERYLYSDGLSGTDYYWNETLLGQLTPFSPIGYYNFENNQESPNYVDGYSQLTQKNIKYYSDEHPFKLVYASSSFTDEQQGVMSGVFVYQINKNYTPFD